MVWRPRAFSRADVTIVVWTFLSGVEICCCAWFLLFVTVHFEHITKQGLVAVVLHNPVRAVLN